MDQITQEQYENLSSGISCKISTLRDQIRKLEAEQEELNKQAREINDPHSLIPKSYNSLAEWADGHPFPNLCENYLFKNKHEAWSVQISCNTFQEYYHIVKEN